jgi:hypothetical protein
MECIHEKYCKLSISVVWLIKTEAISLHTFNISAWPLINTVDG